jgi:error-prone DNA polymerase
MTGWREVVHLIAHRITDLSSELASIGELNGTVPLQWGRGDEAKTMGRSDPRETFARKAREIFVLVSISTKSR